MDVFKEQVWNASNALSILRILLLPAFFYLALHYKNSPGNPALFYPLLGVIFVSIISDFLDGFLARLWHQETMLGRYLDPVADKMTSLSALTIITVFFDFPLWVLIFILIREVLNVWAGSFLYFKRNMQGKPNIWGKIAIGLTAMTVLWYISLPWFKFYNPQLDGFVTHPEYLAWLLVATISLGIYGYWRSYWNIAFNKDSSTSEKE